METKLKSIEEKLDIIIAAMSVNPDFENFVKEKLRNIEIEKITKEVNEKLTEWISKVNKQFLSDFRNYTESYATRLFPSNEKVICFQPRHDCPVSIHEFITELMNEAKVVDWDNARINKRSFIYRIFYEEGFCTAYKKRIIELHGPMPNLEEELLKIK